MKINPTIKIITLAIIISAIDAQAWSGYDYENKTQIDIGPGNLVREGLVIQFYDVRNDAYYMGKVLLLEENSGSETTIKIEDIDTGKERIFLMIQE